MSKSLLVVASGSLLLAAVAFAATDRGAVSRSETARTRSAPPAAANFAAMGGTQRLATGVRRLPANDDHRTATRMAATRGTSPPPPPACKNPGANPVSGNIGFSLDDVIAACSLEAGLSTENGWARSFSAAEIGSAYSFSCIAFGVVNTGSPLDATISVYIDPTGGAPQIAELQLLRSYPFTMPSGFSQYLSVEGEPLCVTLEGDETLVVVMDTPASTTGFASGRGGQFAVSPTYVRSKSCDVADFVDLAAIGFPNNHWFIELSGNFGCEDGIVGDLNDDGFVNGQDLGILLTAWNTADPVADLDGSGLVDGADLGVLLNNWTSLSP